MAGHETIPGLCAGTPQQVNFKDLRGYLICICLTNLKSSAGLRAVGNHLELLSPKRTIFYAVRYIKTEFSIRPKPLLLTAFAICSCAQHPQQWGGVVERVNHVLTREEKIHGN